MPIRCSSGNRGVVSEIDPDVATAFPPGSCVSSFEPQIGISLFRSFRVYPVGFSETVNRRQFLGAIAGLAGTSIAGCTTLADETVLEAPTEQQDGQSVYYRYEHEDDEVLRVSFNTSSETAAMQRLRAYIEQPADTILDAYRFRLKSDPTSNASADVYLRPPTVGHADEFATYRDNDWAVVEGKYEDERRVTTRLELLVFGDGQSERGLPPLLVDYEVILSGDGYFDDRLIARDQQAVAFQNPDN